MNEENFFVDEEQIGKSVDLLLNLISNNQSLRILKKVEDRFQSKERL